ncbi:9739_t:CDS:2 [Paraglomus occultum]|uniref:Amino-acid acetyltransferase, mitochondrial n=1 Tax=Paraglomus occultum TaxID=144539 RepID=A0A9N8ZJM1_9GLOM|nr:9739_t:CDS:2 [Paraglomus occultum]
MVSYVIPDTVSQHKLIGYVVLFNTDISDETIIEPTYANERDLILSVLHFHPTKREINSYKKRHVKTYPSPAASTPVQSSPRQHETIQQKTPQQLQQTSREQRVEFINKLFQDTIEHLALIKIQSPFTPLNLSYVAKTLVHLQKLGLMPIAVLDNEYWNTPQNQQYDRLRDLMIAEALNVTEAIESAGGRAAPVYTGVFSTENKLSDYVVPTPATDGNHHINVCLSWLRNLTDLGQIPLILPTATNDCSTQRTISSNSGMVALSYALAHLKADETESDTEGSNEKMAFEPTKIVVINSEGGIPSPERKGSHVFVNIQSEYDDIKNSYQLNPQWYSTHPTGLENLEMIKKCLEHLPITSSAIMVPAHSPTGLIANLITDKPLFSSSLPIRSASAPLTTTTVLRHGLKVSYHTSFSTLNIDSMVKLIESSFERRLDVDNYLKRMETCIDSIILVGDYQGAAVITKENEDGASKGNISYLDKFVVTPDSQGIGVADILWKRIEVNYPSIVWRARADNKINKWYFERSTGNMRVPGTNWTVFWYGMEGIDRINDYIKVCRKIPPSLHS